MMATQEKAWTLEAKVCKAFNAKYIEDLKVNICTQSIPFVQNTA
jgi:hypothetical protein